ncbi:MAG: AbrB family transcriptional regulator [Candidatus Accumulibacter sp.]|jgi:antitoxin VapB|nr:AbrB family transcriptional regulator [Accumulibacter sp.]
MSAVFETRQFRAGNSQAVRLPAKLAYPPETELTVTRVGDKIIIEPKEETLAGFVEWLRMAGNRTKGQEWERVEMDFPEKDWS